MLLQNVGKHLSQYTVSRPKGHNINIVRCDRISEPEEQPLLGNGRVNEQQYQSHS
jgi:hypothetical protein